MSQLGQIVGVAAASDGLTIAVAGNTELVDIQSRHGKAGAPARDIAELATLCMTRCPDYLSAGANRFADLDEMFGKDLCLTVTETKGVLDELYVIATNDLNCVDGNGTWLLYRHEEHQERYSLEAETDRKRSVCNIGVLQGYREPPYYQKGGLNTCGRSW